MDEDEVKIALGERGSRVESERQQSGADQATLRSIGYKPPSQESHLLLWAGDHRRPARRLLLALCALTRTAHLARLCC